MNIIDTFRLNNLDIIYRDYIKDLPKLPLDISAKQYMQNLQDKIQINEIDAQLINTFQFANKDFMKS